MAATIPAAPPISATNLAAAIDSGASNSTPSVTSVGLVNGDSFQSAYLSSLFNSMANSPPISPAQAAPPAPVVAKAIARAPVAATDAPQATFVWRHPQSGLGGTLIGGAVDLAAEAGSIFNGRLWGQFGGAAVSVLTSGLKQGNLLSRAAGYAIDYGARIAAGTAGGIILGYGVEGIAGEGAVSNRQVASFALGGALGGTFS